MKMVSIVRTAILFSVAMAMACAPKPLPTTGPGPLPEMPGQPAYRDAEQAFADGRYIEALENYQAFLREADGAPSVDAALFKIGTIYRLTDRQSDALAVFSRLIREFPASSLVPDAMLEILGILFRGGQFDAVVARGTAYTESTDPTLRRTPFLTVIADAYAALGDHLNAARFYYRAWNTASGADSDAVWNQLKRSAGKLDAGDLQRLISPVSDRRVMSLLLYQLGLAFIVEENYDEAMDVLQAFVDRFPDHPDHQDAVDMIRSLTERARFTPFTVGVVLPLSGAYAMYGQRALNGIELAWSQAAALTGGIPYQLVVEDSRSDPEAAAEAVVELDGRKVGAILGPMSESEAAAEAAQSKGIPIVVFTGREGIPDIGPYIFRNFITPKMQVRSLVSFAVEQLNVRRFAILYPDEKYGRHYMNLFWDQVIEQGGVVNGVESYDPEGTDFAVSIKKLGGIFYEAPKDLIVEGVPRIRSSRSGPMTDRDDTHRHAVADALERISGLPLDRKTMDQLGRRSPDRDDQWHPVVDFDAVFIPDAPKKAGLVIPQLAYYDIRDVYLLGTNLWNSETLLDMSGEYMGQTLIVDGFFADSRLEQVAAFVKSFQLIYDRIPGIVEALAYDSAMMVFQTMRQTATDSRRDLKQALLNRVVYQGVTGQTAFESNGEAHKTLQMLRIRRGRVVPVESPAES